MSKDERRHRIPTSDELEQQGALTPAAEARQEKRGGLRRFFRVSRFRVSDDVAARKHVGSAQSYESPPPRADKAQREAAPGRPQTGTTAQPTEPIVPRKIRIDPAVKERRGYGGPRGS